MEIKNIKGEFFFKGEFILDNVDDIKTTLVKMSSKIKTKVIKLNFNDVLEIDSAGLQIILSFCRTLKDKKIGYTTESISEEIKHILEISGLGKYLNLI